MKKTLLSFLFMMIGIVAGFAQDVNYTLSFTSISNKNSSYADSWKQTCDGKDWTINNFNNNNGGWTNQGIIKCGRKGNASVAYITTDFAIPEAIKTVKINTTAMTAASVNSIYLQVAASIEELANAEKINFTVAIGEQSVTVSSPAENMYYRVTFDCKSASGNGIVSLFSIEYSTSEGGTPDPVEMAEVENIAAFIAKADLANAVKIKNSVTAVAQMGNALFVKDNSGWLQIYGNTGFTYNNGDVIPGGFSGKYILYSNAVPEMGDPLDGFKTGVAGTPVEPTEVIVDDISAEPINSYVVVKGATISGVNGRNAEISDESGKLAVYNSFNITLTAGEDLTVKGIVSKNGDNFRFAPIEILTASGKEKVAAPTFTPAAGKISEGGSVEIKCATEGAEIYYTLDGSEPSASSTKYTNSIEIVSDVTIKAIAIKDGMENSEIVTATYTLIVKEEVENIAAFIAKADLENAVVIKNSVTAVAQMGNALFVKDDSGWLQIYGNTGFTYNNGDVIPGGFSGKYVLYGNAVPEMGTPLEGFQAGVAGTPVEPTEVIVDDISGEPINSYLVVKGAKISGINGKNAEISDESGKLAVYNSFNITLTAGENLTVTGIVSKYGNNFQFAPIEILTASGKEKVTAPTFTPAAGEIYEGEIVEIKCATEGAEIYYTLDGTEPSATAIEYTGGIEITSDITIKAIAVKEGMDDSEIVTAAYTIKKLAENETLFDFANPSTLTPSFTEGDKVDGSNGTYVNTDAIVFTSKGVSFTAVGSQKYMQGETEKTSTPGRLYFQSGGAIQLRVYNYGIVTITAPGNNKITKVEFGFNNTSGTNLNGGDNQVTLDSTKKIGTFTSDEGVESVEFKAKGTVQINTVNVTCQNNLSGVESVNEEINVNAPIEFYNLNGVRVNNPAKGIYIMRQGNKVSKVVVR